VLICIQGIGDTTQPIPAHILSGLVNGASKLGTKEGYSGYGAEQGTKELREKIAAKLYNNLVNIHLSLTHSKVCFILTYPFRLNQKRYLYLMVQSVIFPDYK